MTTFRLYTFDIYLCEYHVNESMMEIATGHSEETRFRRIRSQNRKRSRAAAPAVPNVADGEAVGLSHSLGSYREEFLSRLRYLT
jgi:hypothetical protein